MEKVSSIIEIFSKVEKYFLPSYDILPEKSNEIFPQIVGCVEDIIQRIVPQVNILRLRHFLTLSLDFFAAKINEKLNEFKNNNSRDNYIKLLEVQKGFRFCKDRIEMLNKLYFRDAQINLKNNVFDKVDNKVNEL